jgi:hypothetical protein
VKPKLHAAIDVEKRLINDNDTDHLNIQSFQHIPKSFLDYNRVAREDSLDQKESEYMSVASVPVAVHEQWLREGFDMMQEPAREILKRLQAQDLTAFITTKKAV